MLPCSKTIHLFLRFFFSLILKTVFPPIFIFVSYCGQSVHIFFNYTFFIKVFFNKLMYFNVVNTIAQCYIKVAKVKIPGIFSYKHYEWQYICIQIHKK